jgi:hypothetical protein
MKIANCVIVRQTEALVFSHVMCIHTYLDPPPTSGSLCLHRLFHHQAGADHGTFRVTNDGVNFRVVVDHFENIVKGRTPDWLVPVFSLAAILEQAHRVLGVYAMWHVTQASQVREIVTMARVEKPVKGPRSEIVLPPNWWLDLVCPLAVGKRGKASSLELISQRS